MSARNKRSLDESLQTRSLPQCCLLAMDVIGALLESGKRKKSSLTINSIPKAKTASQSNAEIWTEMEPQANHKRIWIWQTSCSPATALICKEINGHIDTRSTSKTTSFPLIISSFRSLKIPQCRRLVYFFFLPTFFFVLYVFSLFFFYFLILFCFSLT